MEKMLVTSISPFRNMFSTLPNPNLNLRVKIILSSGNALNLDQSKILLCGKELTHSLTHHFETVPNSKKLQTITEMWLAKDFKIQIAYKNIIE